MKDLAASGEILRRGVLAILITAIYTTLCWRPEWMTLAGIDYMGRWFIDTHACLSAGDAVAAGLNPYIDNPLDMMRRPHRYSDWWFALHSLGLTRADDVWLGAIWGLSFLVVALFQVRVRTIGELAWSAAFLVSPPFVFGFNRGNPDLLVVIVLSVTVPCLLALNRAVRWLAPASIFIAAGLKFYPFTAALVLLRPGRSRREVWMMLAAFAVLTLWFIYDQRESFRYFVTDPPRPSGFFTFGVGSVAQALQLSSRMMTALLMIVFAATAVGSWRAMPEWIPSPAVEAEYLRFVLGAILLLGCYAAGVNFGYRLVLAVWMAPFLWTMWRAEDLPATCRSVGRVVGVLLMGFLWIDGASCLLINLSGPRPQTQIDHWMDNIMLAQQPFVAALMLGLVWLLVPFVRRGLTFLLAGFSPPESPGKS